MFISLFFLRMFGWAFFFFPEHNHRITGLSLWGISTDVSTPCVNTVKTPSADLWNMTCEPGRAEEEERERTLFLSAIIPGLGNTCPLKSLPAQASSTYSCLAYGQAMASCWYFYIRAENSHWTSYSPPQGLFYQDNLQIRVKKHPILGLAWFIQGQQQCRSEYALINKTGRRASDWIVNFRMASVMLYPFSYRDTHTICSL